MAGPAREPCGGAGHGAPGRDGGRPGSRRRRCGEHRRAHTVRQGPSTPAGTERLETAVSSLSGLRPDAQDGTPEPGRQPHRRAFPPTPMHAVVVRTWHHRAAGPAGQTVFLTKASGNQPWRPCDDDEARRRIEPGSLQARQPPWRVTPPPQTTARAVRVHVMVTWLLCAFDGLSAAVCARGYRRRACRLAALVPPAPGAHAGAGLRLCPSPYGISHRAESSRRVGVHIHARPPGIGTRPQRLATYRLTA
jgi:hypothetical protein